MKARTALLLTAAALAAGILIGRGCARRPSSPPEDVRHAGSSDIPAEQVWTCSMHPQIRQPKPGKCPLCGMDLIPAHTDKTEEAAAAPRRLTLSPAAERLAEIETAPVERRAVAVDVRLTGQVAFDETRLAYVTARVPGRIDRLYANYLGMPVVPGEHLADLYSPDLLTAQQELLITLKSGGLPGNAERLAAIRERLRLWGVTREQIAAVERDGKAGDHLTFYSPIGGIVVEKEAREGLYAETGTRLFTLADMSRLWVLLDAYEADLAWLRYAQRVTFTVEAYPGETFTGTISFLAPTVDPVTRTVRVRVNVSNADGRLKPGLFVHAVVRADVTSAGTVAPTDLRGKWISPMHPEIVKDHPGTCDVCGMPLVRAEDLGYAAPTAADTRPLVIPASAPLLTGTRAVVYVAVPEKPGTFEGREIVLGPRAGDVYLVREGLREGERVVVNGAFKIDSSLQIQAKPSMMMPQENRSSAPAHQPTATVPDAFRQRLNDVLTSALPIAEALAKDDLQAARTAAEKTANALAAIGASLPEGDALQAWMAAAQRLSGTLAEMRDAQRIDAFRTAFAALSTALSEAVRTFGPLRAQPLYELRCPMAFENRGAVWLQTDKTVRNPYFGAAMPGCGEVIATLPGGAGHE